MKLGLAAATAALAVALTACQSQPPNPGDTRNCGDFRNQAAAQAWFDRHYPYYGDVARLDADNDRIACESNR